MSERVVDRRAVASHGGALVLGGVLAHCAGLAATGPDPNADLAQVVTLATNEVDDYWAAREPGWRDPRVVIVADGGAPTPCGRVDAGSGPFYCPADRQVYLEISFLRSISGDLARRYVIAHEVGHHVQAVRHALGGGGPAVELGADCLAGLALASGHPSAEDAAAALAEAAAVGDDRISPGSSPESWTHGSAEQRQAALARGLAGGPCP